MDLDSGDWRMSVKCIRAGQPRAYADTFHAYRVYFEWISYFDNPNKELKPVEWNEEVIKNKLKGIYRWNDDNKWPGPRLNYIKKIDNGLWEFEVIDDFTD